MPDEDKTFSGSFVLDLRIWWRQVHTLYNFGGSLQMMTSRATQELLFDLEVECA